MENEDKKIDILSDYVLKMTDGTITEAEKMKFLDLMKVFLKELSSDIKKEISA